MNIRLINTSDQTGGAAVACKRFLDAFNAEGWNAKMLVQEKKSDDPSVVLCGNTSFSSVRFALEYIWFNKIAKNPNATNAFSAARVGQSIHSNSELLNADIIQLHWINNSFLQLKELEKIIDLKKPIVWHLHDMWPFTGGCHYSSGCNNYRLNCGNCLFLKKNHANDLSNKIWNQKKQIFEKANITFVAASNWLAQIASESSLCKRHEVIHIPNTINTDFYKPIDKILAKQKLGLDSNKKHILFGAMNLSDTRKGFNYFREAINKIPTSDKFELLVFGKKNESLQESFSSKINELGYIDSEEKMVMVYNAADMFVIPSLEDNLPNTVMESLSCGTPVVGFNTGGVPEMVDHMKNGFIAEQRNSIQLSEGVNWILNSADYKVISEAARAKVLNNYSRAVVTKKYGDLFNCLLKKMHE